MVDAKALSPYLDWVLRDATIPELPNHYRGKVRDNYDLPDGRRIIVATDRLSAFDRILTAIPFKGQVLTQIARFWFDATARHLPQPRARLSRSRTSWSCRRLDILPVEIVVRDYLAGTTSTSILSMYKAGRARDVRHPPSRRPARQPEAAADHHHADHQGATTARMTSR